MCDQGAATAESADVQQTVTTNHIWIDRPRLYVNDKTSITSNKWLSDNVINAAQSVLRQQYPQARG